VGTPGDESPPRLGGQPSFVIKAPLRQKESPGLPCPGPTVTRSPVFTTRISLHRKMVNRGDKRAAECKSTRIALNPQEGIQQ
jgi:hypothetical protein